MQTSQRSVSHNKNTSKQYKFTYLALQISHTMLLEQMLNPAGQSLDRLGLALLHLIDVHTHATLHHNAMIGKVLLDIMIVMAGLQQRLGGDAPDVEAGSTQGAAHFDAGGREAELGGLDGRDVSAGTAADDYYVVLLRGGGGDGKGTGGGGEEGGGRIGRGGAVAGSRSRAGGKGGTGEHGFIIGMVCEIDTNIKHYNAKDDLLGRSDAGSGSRDGITARYLLPSWLMEWRKKKKKEVAEGSAFCDGQTAFLSKKTKAKTAHDVFGVNQDTTAASTT